MYVCIVPNQIKQLANAAVVNDFRIFQSPIENKHIKSTWTFFWITREV